MRPQHLQRREVSFGTSVAGRAGLRHRRRPRRVDRRGLVRGFDQPALHGIRGSAARPTAASAPPKDTCGFLGFAGTIGVDMPLLRAVVEVNDRMEALTGQELDSVVERDMSGADVA